MPNQTIQLMVDCDPGIDDSLALVALAGLHRKGLVNLIGVSSVGGNRPVSVTTRNAAFLLEATGLSSAVPLYPGLDAAGGRIEGGARLHGDDGLGGHSRVPRAETRAPVEDVASRIAAAAEAGPVVVLCVGPLTNLSRWLNDHPGLAEAVSQFVVMGGAFGHPPGNIRPWAEFNFYCDPVAASRVFEAVPITVIPLDVTLSVSLVADDASRLGEKLPWLGAVISASIEAHASAGQGRVSHAHDLTAAQAIFHPEWFDFRAGQVTVQGSGDRAGQSVLDMTGSRDRVAVACDVEALRRASTDALRAAIDVTDLEAWFSLDASR